MAVFLISFILGMVSGFGLQEDTSAPSSFDFELKKKREVLRLRSIFQSHGITQAIAVAFQLTKTIQGQQEFDLKLFIDGRRSRKERFKAGQPITFRPRGISQPYQILVSEVSRNSIRGKIVPLHSKFRVDIDRYTRNGKFIKPGVRWLPQSSHAEKAKKAAPPQKASDNPVPGIKMGVRNPVLLYQNLPSCTEGAIEAKRTSGTVLLLVVVRRDGSVDGFKVLKSMGYRGLDEVAIEEIANGWRFRPGTLGGQPVDVRATIEINFGCPR